MSQINQLKENKDNNVNLVELLQMLFPDLKTKYYEFVIRLIKSDISDYNKLTVNNTTFQNIVLNGLKVYFDKKCPYSVIKSFVDFNERDLIEKNDLSKYKSFLEVKIEVDKSVNAEKLKKLECEVVKLLDDEDWLVIKPLTYESSVKYGYGTKWCTAMETQSSYFKTYTNDGILIYCIQKQIGKKVAFYVKKSRLDLSFWDAKDKKIDSMESGLPEKVITVIQKELLPNVLKSNGEINDERVIKDFNKRVNDTVITYDSLDTTVLTKDKEKYETGKYYSSNQKITNDTLSNESYLKAYNIMRKMRY